ncbi:tautomerase PptA [Atlantibacter hermannii]|uniref:tautomerase PptA n=1 Tax=Atlantibacter hermannii TaxID=565 RepID=UPI00289B24A9|nr:tautomerase PptA [Atlantibacter hermannii]
MPHVDIKYFPRELTEEQRLAFADDIAKVVIKHLDSKPTSVSVALEEVQPDNWKQQVWDTDIAPHLDTLAKKPGYSM